MPYHVQTSKPSKHELQGMRARVKFQPAAAPAFGLGDDEVVDSECLWP